MAVSLTAIELAAALGVNQALADRLLPVAVALVERYLVSSVVPEAVKREAVIRTSGWLADRPSSSLMSEEYGDVKLQWASGQLSALRHSGAMSILSPWRIRRGGAI